MMSAVRWDRLWASTGMLAGPLFVCGLVFADLVGSGNYPPLDAPPSTVSAYFIVNAVQVRTLSFFHALSAIALLCFAAYLATHMRRVEQPGLAALGLVGGTTAAGFLLLSALCYRVLAEPEVAHDASLSHALLVLSYLAGGPAISAPLTLQISAGAVLAVRRLVLPRWTGWLGVAAAAVSLASAAVLLGPMNNHTILYGILLLAAVLGFLWVFAASAALTSRSGRK